MKSCKFFIHSILQQGLPKFNQLLCNETVPFLKFILNHPLALFILQETLNNCVQLCVANTLGLYF